MTEFKGNAKDGFGPVGFLSHLFISLSVLLVIFAMIGFFFSENELYETLLGVGGGGVVTGIGLGFINIFLTK